MRKTVLPGAVAALVLAAPAMADNFSYNILEFGIVGSSVDDQSGDLDTEGHGLSLDASVELTPNLFGFLELSRVSHEFKYYEDGFDIGRGALGAGVNFPLAAGLDLVAGASVQKLRMESEFDAFSGYGYGLNLGLRGGAGKLEWTVGMEYVDLDFDLSGDESFDAADTMFNAGLRYRFTRLFALGLDVAGNGDDEASAAVAFRWNFANRD